jgi:hypothetical protein
MEGNGSSELWREGVTVEGRRNEDCVSAIGRRDHSGPFVSSFLALVLKQELEKRMKKANLQWEWAEVTRGFDNLQQVDANFQGRRFQFAISSMPDFTSEPRRGSGASDDFARAAMN